MAPLTRGLKRRAIRESPLQPVGNGLDRSTNLPVYWGRLPHSVREMSRSDRGRPPPSAGGTRKARDGRASHIKIRGRAWKPAPTNGAPSRRPLRTKWNFHGRAGACSRRKVPEFGEFCSRRLCPLSEGLKLRAIRESPLQPVGNGLDRSAKLYQITRANTVRPYE